MTNTQIGEHYSTGLSRRNIERTLSAAGQDLDHLRPADLAPLEDFHTMGRIATSQLVDMVGVAPEAEVLDAGCGICETARWLNRLVGLDGRISVGQADVTELPFADAVFDVVFSQHVQMNIADKARLYREERRVLVGGGRIALWDITASESGDPDFPLPWADRPALSHLVTSDQLRGEVESAGFEVDHWNDLTDQASALMQALLALPPNPLGLHAFVADFAVKARNLTTALAGGRLRVIQGIARATV